jgi:phosphate starvation-inducible PhoH-like protein
MVVCGDSTQVDLPTHTRSGLVDAIDRLKTIPGVCLTSLDKEDIVRHGLVQAIVRAYEEEESSPRK